MTKTLTFLEKEYIFVGTAHVSKQSVFEVESVIGQQLPDYVCVELDRQRFRNLIEKRQWNQTDLIKIFKEKKAMLLLGSLVLSSFQRRIGGKIEPGSDMRVAIETAKQQGSKWVLCDRELNITLTRAWRKSGIWSKCKLLASLISSIFSSKVLDQRTIESLTKGNEIDTMMKEMSSYLPSIKSVLIDERDQYIAQKIYDTPGKKIVAVLGAGHLEGVIRNIEELQNGSASIDLKELSYIPAPGKLSVILPWIIPLIILSVIGSGFFTNEWTGVLENIWRWTLVNGSLSALGALIALAHPLTIVASFLCAPLTSLNPTIGVGFLTGLCQLWVKTPQTSDFERISSDIKSTRGFFRNRITRALLVFFFTSLGSAVGTFIALPLLFP